MIEIQDCNGRKHFVAPSTIAKVSEASGNSQWHGIRCYVKLFDGSVIESSDEVKHIVNAIANEEANRLNVATALARPVMEAYAGPSQLAEFMGLTSHTVPEVDGAMSRWGHDGS